MELYVNELRCRMPLRNIFKFGNSFLKKESTLNVFQILPNVRESFTALYSRIHQHYRISSAATTQAETREEFKYSGCKEMRHFTHTIFTIALIFGLIHPLRRQKGDIKQNVTHVPEASFSLLPAGVHKVSAETPAILTDVFVFFFGPFR